MHCHAKIHKAGFKPGAVAPLLTRAREVYELESAPGGCAGCKDWELLEKLVKGAVQ